MMTRQSMARVSSASTEADVAPAMTPFDWEAAFGRPGRKSTNSGFSGNTAVARRNSFEAPPLPFPPGRRPKDGFSLPYSQADESPDMQSKVKLESGKTSSQPRTLFNLKIPGSSKKPPSTSWMRLPYQSSSKPSRDSHVEEDHRFGIFNPISGHRVSSSITRRMLAHLTKKQSLWRRCLPPKPESEKQRQESSPHIDHNKGRRLNAVDEGFFTAADSPVSGPSLPSSPRHGLPNWSNSSPVVTMHMQPASLGHGHRHSRNSSPLATKQMLQPSSPAHGYSNSSTSSPVASRRLLQPPSSGHDHSSGSSPVVTKQLQVASSRFMASMLISLCPEADDSDEPQFDAVDDFNDDISISHMTTPRTKASPEALFETLARPSECYEIVADPASQTVLSHEECRCTCKHRAHISAKGDLSTLLPNQRRKTSRSVSRSLHAELATARSPSQHLKSGRLVQHGDSADKLDENTVTEQKDNADAYLVFFKASSNRESMRRREPYHSTLSWKPCTQKSCSHEEPVADVVASDPPQEPGISEFAKEIYVDVGEKYERRRGSRSPARDFSADSNSSSNSSEYYSQHSNVWSRPDSISPSISRDVDVPASKSNCGAAPLSMVGYLSPPRTACASCKLGSEDTSNKEKPKALARWKSTILEGRSERNQPPATRASLSFLSPPRKQSLQQNAIPGKIRIKDRNKVLKPSSQRQIPPKALTNDDTDDSDEDSECSADSSQNTTPRAVKFASQKPASPVVQGENLLESPSLLKFKLQRQQCHRESLPSPFMVDKETAPKLPGPSSKLQVLLTQSHSVRSSSSRVLTPQECHAISADTNFRGSDFASASRLGRTSYSAVMSKVAEWESKAGVGSSGKSEPLYQFSQRTISTGSTTTPYKPAAR